MSFVCYVEQMDGLRRTRFPALAAAIICCCKRPSKILSPAQPQRHQVLASGHTSSCARAWKVTRPMRAKESGVFVESVSAR